MPKTKRAILTVALVLPLLAGCDGDATPTLPPAPTPTVPPSATPPPAPAAAAALFLDAWQAGDHAAMYAYLSPASRSSRDVESFAQRYRNELARATVLTTTARLQAVLQEGDHARAAFHLTLETALVGALTAQVEMSLSFVDGRWWVDWDEGLIWPQLAGGNSFWMERTVPVRANVYDRNGLGLAVEGVLVTVGVVPGQIEDEPALLAALSLVTGFSPEVVRGRYVAAAADWKVPIADVPAEISVDYNAQLSSIAGIYREEKEGRTYPQGWAAPHLVGWVAPVPADRLEDFLALGYRGDERVGVSGLEAWGEEILAGRQGGRLTVVSPAGDVVATVAERAAVPSRAIHTTIDREFQEQVARILGDRKGAIVVLDANSGAVRAIASGPGFDANVFVGPSGAVSRSQILADSRRLLINRASQATYPAASVFKIVTTAAALEEGGMHPVHTGFYCPGYWEGLGPSFRKGCWKEDGHGNITLQDGLTASCDVTFYEVGVALDGVGQDVLPRFARAFGFGEPTGIAGIVEASDEQFLVPDPEWKVNVYGEPWWVGDTVNLAIGQGYLLVSPLQMARMIAAAGNGGTLYRPYVIGRIAAAGDLPEQVTQPEVVGTLPVSPENLAAIQQALLGVTTRSIGTAEHRFAGLSVSVAGKTGTAEVGSAETMPHSWFAGYAPANQPEIAIAIIVENAGEGSSVAAPLTRQVVEAYFGLPLSTLPPVAEVGYATPTPEP